MSLVSLVSAKGAPGVTTLSVALAALTPGSVVADLDPEGGDLALRYRRDDGVLFDPERGLLSLAASLRRDPTDFTASGPVDGHLQTTGGGLEMLLGVRGPEQAHGLGSLWPALARALAESDRLVFADCGRVGPASPVMPVLVASRAVIVVARAELVELAHLRERLRFLNEVLPGQYAGRARIGVVLVAPERDRAAGPRTEQLLRSSKVAVPVLGTIADDPRGAERLQGMTAGRAGRTTLIRSVRSLLPAVHDLIGSAVDETRTGTDERYAPPAGPVRGRPMTPAGPPAPDPESLAESGPSSAPTMAGPAAETISGTPAMATPVAKAATPVATAAGPMPAASAVPMPAEAPRAGAEPASPAELAAPEPGAPEISDPEIGDPEVARELARELGAHDLGAHELGAHEPQAGPTASDRFLTDPPISPYQPADLYPPAEPDRLDLGAAEVPATASPNGGD